ncbi:hypothetical protein N9Y26_00775 [bacterium]|nr:hypothetical protein [bacterium]
MEFLQLDSSMALSTSVEKNKFRPLACLEVKLYSRVFGEGQDVIYADIVNQGLHKSEDGGYTLQSNEEKEELKEIAQDLTKRKSINFTNVML